ncbi:MAG: Clp1/GlmU family protein [Candidatus Bathyarchaeia archaeon]
MRQTIEGGKTLLVDGPACISLYSGALRAFGAPIKVGDHIIIRRGRRIPLEALEDSEIELLLGNSASYSLIDEDPIPASWKEAAGKIVRVGGCVKVAVLGNVDSGKTSFCTYLANVALGAGRNVALIDGDLGQSDVGPPGTLGLSFVRKPLVDPFNLQPSSIVFVGITSPSSVIEPTINGLVELVSRALVAGSDFIVVNTDGWVEGLDAVNYKLRLIKSLQPNFVVAIQDKDELKPLVDLLTGLGISIVNIETPRNIKRRDRETRKLIRESSYRRFLRDAKVRSYPLSWVKVDGCLGIRGKQDQILRKRMDEVLGDRVVYCESCQDSIILVLREGATLSDEERVKILAELNKPLRIIHRGDEKGLLVALEDEKGCFLGIGTINCVDFERGTIKIYTNVDGPISRIRVGQIRLDERGNEIEVVGGLGMFFR